MPRKSGGVRRKRRTHKTETPPKETDNTPRSFVFRRGNIPTGIRDLVPDLRRMLSPHTAGKLKERRGTTMRDYVSVGRHMGVSHFWILSATQRSPYLRLARLPQGPTLTLQICEYTLAADIRAMQKRPTVLREADFTEPPLLVLNNFADAGKEMDLVAETLRHSFPPIDVNTVRLSALRRVLLVHRDEETGSLYVRHYALKVQQANLSKPVRKMVTKRRIPNMRNLADVSQMMDSAAAAIFSSDSEGEETAETITLPQGVHTVLRGTSSRVKLTEVGPRMTLQLVKAQAGICDGAVLFHRFVHKDEVEVRETEQRLLDRTALKRKRKDVQEANVRRKEDAKRVKRERRKEAKTRAARLRGEISDDGEKEQVAEGGKE